MSKNKWVRSISFNKTNEKDIARLKLIGKKSFSRFIKKLLDEEIKRQNNIPTTPKTNETPKMQQRVNPIPKPPNVPNKPRIAKPKPYNPMLRRD